MMGSDAMPIDQSAQTRRPIRILVVDDHPLLRDGIDVLIEGQLDMELVGEACDGREGIEEFARHAPDIVLMDLQMPEINGVEAIIAILKKTPDARIIVLTTYYGDAQILSALKAGARAYLLKDLLHEELLDTIRAVHAGRRTMSPLAAAEVAAHAGDDALTPRETDVLRFIARGHANKEIAARLSITEEAVKSRVRSILTKLRAGDRTHATVIGLKRGIIDL
jgi:DNA-binding NarL/FixJ family response regulator